MKLKNALIIFGVAIIFLVSVSYFFISHLVPYKTQIIEFDAKVVDGAPGFNLDKDKMHFGSVCIQCPSTRQIVIRNDQSFSERIDLDISSTSSEMLDWITMVPASGHVLDSGKQEIFQITFSPSYIAERRLYEGNLIVNRYKPFFWE